MNTDENQAALRRMATPGVSQVNINRSKMLAMRIAVPPPEEQREQTTALGVEFGAFFVNFYL